MRVLVPEKERTTIVASKLLMDRVSQFVLKIGDNQSNFITRAIVNQLETEAGDVTIREELKEEENAD